jgi:hypothetical protein
MIENFFKRLLGIQVSPTLPIPASSPISPMAPTQPPVEPATPDAAEAMARTKALGPTIAIVNQSTCLTDAQIANVVPDLQIQVDRDFAPAWGTRGNLVFVPKGAQYPINAWVVYILDTSDQAGALGYHDMTNAGMPVSKVFAKDDVKYGLSWTVTVSHEILEMLADPYCSYTVFDQQSNTTGMLYALEVCDAIEDDSFGYKINDTLVSDFVYPQWFEGFRRANSTRFDHTSVLTAPFTLAKGGYIGIFQVGPSTAGWTQKQAEAVPGVRLRRKGPYARTNRRGKA